LDRVIGDVGESDEDPEEGDGAVEGSLRL